MVLCPIILSSPCPPSNPLPAGIIPCRPPKRNIGLKKSPLSFPLDRHIVMVVLGVYDGLMNVPTAIVMGVGYVLLAAILGLEWGTCVSLTGTVWMGISEHFFNNFIGNALHIVTESGTDEWQIVRVVFSNLLSLGIVLLISRRRGKRAKEKGPAGL